MPTPSQRGDIRSIALWLVMVEVLMLPIVLSTDYSGYPSPGYTVKMNFTCPTCDVSLQSQKPGGVLLWKCASCSGLVVSLPTVRKGLKPQEFKKIWQQLYSGKTKTGRPCPGCKKPLTVVKADGQDDEILIDVCRRCQVLWFDDKEFSSLPRAEPEPVLEYVPESRSKSRPESRLLTPEEIAFASFKRDQYQRRSFLFKLLDGSVLRELGFDSFFGRSD